MCRGCFSEYMRKYRKTTETQAVRRARKDGFEAMRMLAVAAFERIGTGELSGLTAAEIVREIA